RSKSCPNVALFLEYAPAQFSLANTFMAAAAATPAVHRASVPGDLALAAEFPVLAEWYLALVRSVPAAELERSFARVAEPSSPEPGFFSTHPSRARIGARKEAKRSGRRLEQATQ